MGDIDLGRVGIWTGVLDQAPSSRAVELASELEDLGYGAIWFPEAVGRDPFVIATLLLRGTSSIRVATGIANIYARDPMTTANAQRTITEAFPGRFLLGLGVSHQHLVQDIRKHEYSRPLSYMREYLVRMREAPFFAHGPQDLPEIVLAALRPQDAPALGGGRRGSAPLLRAARAHCYRAPDPWGPARRFTPSRWSCSTPTQRRHAPWPARTWRCTSGCRTTSTISSVSVFEQSDIDGGPSGGPSDRLVDAIVAWGTPEQVTSRVQEHFDAGADHVGVQVLADGLDATVGGWRILAPHFLG